MIRLPRRTIGRALDVAPVILLLLLVVVFGLVDNRVVAPENLRNVLVQATTILLLGLGAHVVLLTGGIDLSAGMAVAFCSFVMAGRLDAGNPLGVALLAGLIAMAALGAVNGYLIGYLRIPPFIVTLATMVAIQGATLQAASQGVLILKNETLHFIGLGNIGPMPVAILVVAAVAVGAWLVMRHTRFGLRTYALGSDPAAAQLAGIPIPRQQFLTYLVAAGFTFLTSVLMISRVPVVTPNLGGTALLLDAIAAAVIGGTSIFGGRGTVGGVVAGAVIVSLLTNALRVFGVDPSSIDLFKGGIIIAALAADAGMTRWRGNLREQGI